VLSKESNVAARIRCVGEAAVRGCPGDIGVGDNEHDAYFSVAGVAVLTAEAGRVLHREPARVRALAFDRVEECRERSAAGSRSRPLTPWG
jgi:hypothetical protein